MDELSDEPAPLALHGGSQGSGAAAALPPLPRPASPVGAAPRSPLYVLLQQCSLQQHAAALEENGFDVGDVGGLSSDDLREMGITKLKERKIMLAAFAEHTEGATDCGEGSAAAAAAPVPVLTGMSASAKARTIDALSCNICMEMFEQPPGKRTPKTLPCMHCFCECCLILHVSGE